jgi:nucleoside-diphosphate-sugar epimerase
MGDITNLQELRKLPGVYDWVVNCVSSSGGGAEDYRRVYLEGTRNLIDWLVATPLQKFVYTSSTGVYGQTEGEWVEESAAAEPASETAKILRETEVLLLDSVQKRSFPAVILRVAGIYGPGRGYWFRQFLKNEAKIEGAGERVLNMIHRDDVAGAVLAALGRGRPGEIYNAVDDELVTQLDFFHWLSATLGRPLPPRIGSEENSARKRGLTNKRVSNRKLKAELGYQFIYPTFRAGYASDILREKT